MAAKESKESINAQGIGQQTSNEPLVNQASVNDSAADQNSTLTKTLEDLEASIEEREAYKGSLISQIAALENVKDLLINGFGKQAEESQVLRSTAAADLPTDEQDVDISFQVPAILHDGVEWKTKDLERLIVFGDREAIKILEHLVKTKSGAITVRPKKGDDE